ncbi:tripartite tricarboxylate transporter substrate binding protein [Ramlibacter albus]|uniref:Tripartite tricarboxylate transporter substrate binding protein n=1 Tax=Ramlibacter albus TaxID=2079448 RepID=A0A923MCJ6_9BURK|nr:tripartite tricarboxylate transporter substrate binding protein [Ramlibacter albus]MBC5768195.1 tripartite tricarboxylate transporter substrate binding protein [Ramlibacter albus]
MTSRITRRRALAAATLLLAGAAIAQTFPSQPIKLVVPFAPGGGNDILARAIAPRMAEILGQPVIVDNRPGAGGNLGTDAVAKAAPDGHTILIASNQFTINPALGAKTPFNVERDFAPIGQIASVPIVLVANKSQPFNTVPEFIAYARANPGKLSYSSPGNGTPQHLAGEVFARMTKTFMVHIPYRGTGPAIADVVGDQVQVTFATLASVSSFLEAGKLKAIGVAAPRASRMLPGVKSFGENGLKGYDAELWYCLLAPAKTPDATVAKLNAALNQALQSPKVAEQLARQGFDTATSTPAQLRERIAGDLKRWARVVNEHQIKVEL